MSLTGLAVAVVAGVAEVEGLAGGHFSLEGGAVADQRLFRDLREADAADLRLDAGESEVDDLLADADGFEDLRALVGVEHRDAHLRHDLEHALFEGLGVVGHGLLHADAVELALAGIGRDELAHGGEAEVGADGGGAEAEGAGDLVGVADFAGLQHQRAAHALADAVEEMVDGAGGEGRGDRHAAGGGGAIAENQDIDALFHGGGGFGAEFVEADLEAGGSGGERPGDVEDLRGEAVFLEVLQAVDLVLEQDARLHVHDPAVLRRFDQEVALRSEAGGGAHHGPFADRVDRRVGDLGEALLEVGEEQARVGRENRKRGIVTHREHGFLRRLDHRREDHVEFLDRDAVGDLLAGKVERCEVLGRGEGFGRAELAEFEAVLVDPLAVGLLLGERFLDLAIVADGAGGGVHGKHLAGSEAALADDLGVVDDDRAGFRADVEQAVLGELVARGAEAVAVERGAELGAVGVNQAGRAIPGLGEGAVVLVEGAEVVGDVLVVAIGRRDQHAHRVFQRAAGEHQRFEGVVERGGVRLVLVHQVVEQRDVIAPDLALEELLAGGHPVAVAFHGVDLAVVAHHPERLAERPGGEGVGRESLVVEGDRGLEIRVLEIAVEGAQGGRHGETLVGDQAARERRHVETVQALGLALDAAAAEEKLAFEVIAGPARGLLEEEVLDVRAGGQGELAEGVGIDRGLAPADDADAALGDHVFGHRLELLLAGGVVERQEKDRDREIAFAFKRGAELGGGLEEDRVGDLREDPGAVAGLHVGIDRAAVGHVADRAEGELEDLIGAFAMDLGDGTHAAVVALCGEAVKGSGDQRRARVVIGIHRKEWQ